MFNVDVLIPNAATGQTEAEDASTTEMVMPEVQQEETQETADNVEDATDSYWIAQLLAAQQRAHEEAEQEQNEIWNPFFESLQSKLKVIPMQNGVRVQSMSAGDGFEHPWGMWLSFDISAFENDFAATAFDADRNGVMFGADFSPYESVLAGVALGYSNVDLDSSFNRGQADFDTFTVVPYLSINLSEHVEVDYLLTMDFMVGYSNVDIDRFRTNAAGARITSSTGSDRLFFSSNISSTHFVGNWLLSGTLGMILARDDVDGFTESNGTVVADNRVQFGRLRVGGNVAYSFRYLEPFLSLAYEYDYEHEDTVLPAGPQPANDKDQLRLGMGVRLFANDVWSGAFEYDTTFGREDFDSHSFGLSIQATY